MSKLPLNKFTKRNKFTRMCMGEAVIALMKEKSFSDIKILEHYPQNRSFQNDFL